MMGNEKCRCLLVVTSSGAFFLFKRHKFIVWKVFILSYNVVKLKKIEAEFKGISLGKKICFLLGLLFFF